MPLLTRLGFPRSTRFTDTLPCVSIALISQRPSFIDKCSCKRWHAVGMYTVDQYLALLPKERDDDSPLNPTAAAPLPRDVHDPPWVIFKNDRAQLPHLRFSLHG